MELEPIFLGGGELVGWFNNLLLKPIMQISKRKLHIQTSYQFTTKNKPPQIEISYQFTAKNKPPQHKFWILIKNEKKKKLRNALLENIFINVYEKEKQLGGMVIEFLS